ncbi:MAG: nucleotidyltransferase family protein [Ardenticatenales bacterium]
MSIDDLLDTRRNDIVRLATSHGAHHVRVFGSVARGEAGDASDIDFLVDWEPKRTLIDVCDLISDLRELLGREVDVVSEDGLYWLLRRRIVQEARAL